MTTRITAGFLPLIDASILIAAREAGFAEKHDIDLHLVRETSWANIRDRVSIGQLDVAHMLAPMPIAANLGLTPFPDEWIATMALGSGGNAITLSTMLATAIGMREPDLDAKKAGDALRQYIVSSGDRRSVQLGVVHPHSAHNFELRYWLAACGIDPENDVELVILPPPLMPDALASGTIDGYCVGEPWNAVAVERGDGVIVTTKSRIWASSPEKVLGMRREWADHHIHDMYRLMQSLAEAAAWVSDLANHSAFANILARPDYLNQPAPMLESALSGAAAYEAIAGAATFPWQSHALWLYSQMVRWGQVEHTPAHANKVRRTYRPDIYRVALEKTGIAIPAASSKVEGVLTAPTVVGAGSSILTLGPDGFFDGFVFDPSKLDAYIQSQRS